jgi:hypothetical protein
MVFPSVGDFVTITVKSRPELNSRVFKVAREEENKPERVIVESADTGKAVTISIRRANAISLALTPCTVETKPCDRPNDVAMMMRFVIGGNDPSEWRLNQWIRLPGLGGNSIMMRPSVGTAGTGNNLLWFPELIGHELWFHSLWNHETIQLQDADVLKLCPAQQIWPWCSYCQKFLFPCEAHRASSAHIKGVCYIQNISQQRLRSEIMLRISHFF